MSKSEWPEGTEALLDEVLTDAYGDDEQLWAIRQAFEDNVKVPTDAFVIGEPVELVAIDYDGNTRRGLTARCRSQDGGEHVVAASDVVFPDGSVGAMHVAAYCKWLGLDPALPRPQEPHRRTRRHKASEEDLDLSGSIELIVLAPKERAARCRVLGTEREITVRSRDVWNLVPGEIATVQARKQWRFAGHPYLSGNVESYRLDMKALGLVPLRLQDEGLWDPGEEYWGEEGEPLEDWEKPIVARGPRPCFEMEQVLPGADGDDWDSDPILESSDLKAADAIVQLKLDPGTAWDAYGFVQETVTSSGGREDNGRIGAGGSYRPTERFKIDAEVSGGDLGPGGKLGTSFLHSERTRLYLNYSLEDERTDNGKRARRGSLVSGVKTRLSDSSSVYLEERYQDGESLTGLTHATGLELVAGEPWNFGVSAEFGTLRNSETGAETDRQAGGVRVGYGRPSLQVSSAVEYRHDEAEQLDATVAERTVWLLRNTFKLQLAPDWRMVGKLDHADSDSSLGEFHDGGYTEAVVGYAYRPVRHDRLSALAKYTYFYNVPTTDQLGIDNTAAEFIQKSHVASLDVSWDLTSTWTIGGKYAYRLGQVSLDRDQPVFFDNAAQLVVVRADWRFREHWESLAELRALDLPDLGQRRGGALVGLYRYLGKHLKVGAGYNFTDFSDDLTDLDYDHQGAFVNVIGSI